MHVEVRQNEDVMILDLKGKLTAGLGDQILRDAIDELLAESRRKILLNLSEVAFLDSAGVGELVAGLQDGAALRGGAQAAERGRARLQHARHGAPAADLRDLQGRGRGRPLVRGLSRSAAAGPLLFRRPRRRPYATIGSRFVTLSSTEHSGQLMRLADVEVVAVELQVRLALGAAAHGIYLLRVTT